MEQSESKRFSWLGHEKCFNPRKSLQGHQRPSTPTGKRGWREARACSRSPSKSVAQGSFPPSPRHHSSNAQEVAMQEMRTQEFLACLPWPSAPLAILGYTPSVAGWEPRSGSRPCGEQHACIPRQAGTFLLGSHCATGPAPPTPLHTEPLSAPDTLSSRCPRPPTPPHICPLPGGAPRAEHPCPSPQPQRAATPPILEPSRVQRGEMICPVQAKIQTTELPS